ncbi:MAG: hypothetical protein OEQ13_10770 [Acidobacteriota bacterium]|nr:hypothetical protein [Acidobacteriota bacterium]
MLTFIRAVLFAVIAWIIGRALARLTFGGAGRASGERSSAAEAPAPGGPEQLVKDPVCGVCLPEGRALRVATAEGPVFFCSDECRRAHSERAVSS